MRGYEPSYALPINDGFGRRGHAALVAKSRGLGLKWYEYVTGVPNVSECFPGNSEYLANVQRTVQEGTAAVQSVVDQFRTNGPEVAAFMAEPKVKAVLTWCGQRNAFDYYGYMRDITGNIGPRYLAQEANRLAQGGTSSQPPITSPGNITPAAQNAVSSTQFLSPSGVISTEVRQATPGGEGEWWTGLMSQVSHQPPWVWIALGGVTLFAISRRR